MGDVNDEGHKMSRASHMNSQLDVPNRVVRSELIRADEMTNYCSSSGVWLRSSRRSDVMYRRYGISQLK